MTPYQWIGRGPRFRTGSTLMVMKPTGPALTGTAAIMRTCRGRAHLEHAIAALGPDPFDAMTKARQPCGQGVGAEMALDHERCHSLGLEPFNPGEEQLVEGRLAQPYRRVRVHRRKPDAIGDRVRLDGDDVACSCAIGVARTQVE